MRKVRSSNLRGNPNPPEQGAVADGSAAGPEIPRHGNVRGSTPHRSAIFFAFWKANRPGSRHRLECDWYALSRMSIVRSAFRQIIRRIGNVTGRESGARSNRDGWFLAIGDQDLTFPPNYKRWEVQVRTGWCRRRAVNAVPSGKRFDSVRFPPTPPSRLRARGVAPERQRRRTASQIFPSGEQGARGRPLTGHQAGSIPAMGANDGAIS